MEKIYKYDITLNEQHIELPEKAIPLSVGVQNGKIVMWIRLDPDASKVNRVFCVFGTGFEMTNPKDIYEYKHIGTVQMPSGLVWHIFERTLAHIYY